MGTLKTLSKRTIFLASLLASTGLWAATVGDRYIPISTLTDERSVRTINDNFKRVTLNMIDGKLVSVPVSSGTPGLDVALTQAQTDPGYAVFASASWDVSVKVLQKTTTGYRLEFSTWPAVSGTIDSILVR